MTVFPLILAAGAAAGGVDAPVVIDLTIPQPCPPRDDATGSQEIVVCGERERQASYRLRKLDRGEGQAVPKAEVQIAEGATLGVETESADLGMVRSQRAMVRIKLKF